MLAVHSEYAQNLADSHHLQPPWAGLPALPPFYLHSLFHWQPEQTFESYIKSLPCPSPCSGSHLLQMHKSLSFATHTFSLSLLLHISLFILLLWHKLHSPHNGVLAGPWTCQLSAHIRALTVTPLLVPPPPAPGQSPRDSAWTTTGLFQVCSNVTTSVKPHLTTLCNMTAHLLPVTPKPPGPALYLFL